MSQSRSGRIGVIGGGLGGLASACTLAARGYEVVLFEKNAWLGGKAAVLSEGGYRFDMGPTILLMPSVLAADLRRGRPRPGGRARPDPARSAVAVVLRRRLDPRPARRCRTDDPGARRVRPRRGRQPGLSQVPRPLRAARRHLRALLLLAVDRLAPRHVRSDDRGRASRRWATSSRCALEHRGGDDPGPRGRRPGRPRCSTTSRSTSALRPTSRRPCSAASPTCRPAEGDLVSPRRHPRRRRGAGPAGRRARRRVPCQSGVQSDPHRRRRRRSAASCLDDGERVPLAAVVSNCDSVRTHRELLAGTPAAGRFEKRRRLRAGLLGRGPLPRPRPPLRAAPPPQLRLLARSRTRSSTSSTARASPPPTRPATSVPRPPPSRTSHRPAARPSTSSSTRPTCGPTTTGRPLFPRYRRTILDKLRTHRRDSTTSSAGSRSSAG